MRSIEFKDGNVSVTYYYVPDGRFVRFAAEDENGDLVNYNLKDDEMKELKESHHFNSILSIVDNSKKYVVLNRNFISNKIFNYENEKKIMLKNPVNIFEVIKFVDEDHKVFTARHVYFENVQVKALFSQLKNDFKDEYDKLRKEALSNGLITSKDWYNLKELRLLMENYRNETQREGLYE